MTSLACVRACSLSCDIGRLFFQAEDGIRYLVRSRGLGDVYKRQDQDQIEVLYDPDAHPDAELTIEHDPETGAAHLLLDGRPLAVVQNLSLIHI